MAASSNKTTFNVGVIGYGKSAAIFHLPFIAITPSLKLHSILQRKPTEASSAPRDYPDIKHFTSLEPFLADADLDVVVITTPPQTHFALTQQALQASKHVFVEKPFVPTSAEAETLHQLAQQQQRCLCVYQNRRWDADFVTLRTLLDQGRLGRVLEFETHFDRYAPAAPRAWKASLSIDQAGSPLYDLGTHLVDQVYALFGLPRGVFAKLSSHRAGVLRGPDGDPDLEPDAVNLQLFYPQALVVHVRITTLSVEARQPRFWVRGTRGSYRKHGLDPQEPQLAAGMATSDPRFGREDDTEDSGTLVTVDDETDGKTTLREERCPNLEPPPTYARIYQLFADAVRDGGEVPVPASQARDVLRILEAAKESAATRREVSLA
ncbi:oxidoreductase family protein [Xylariomycetidae sp. FL0641]|nr:oxidoreductase family protein [Xylariomycetidae sp. FL0641]